MPEPLKLSKVFGIEIDDVGVPGTYGGGYIDGYNRCLNDLDQLSPDADKLAKIMYLYEINAKDCDWFLVHSGRKIELYRLAQEIINSMPQWIKEG